MILIFLSFFWPKRGEKSGFGSKKCALKPPDLQNLGGDPPPPKKKGAKVPVISLSPPFSWMAVNPKIGGDNKKGLQVELCVSKDWVHAVCVQN